MKYLQIIVFTSNSQMLQADSAITIENPLIVENTSSCTDNRAVTEDRCVYGPSTENMDIFL